MQTDFPGKQILRWKIYHRGGKFITELAVDFTHGRKNGKAGFDKMRNGTTMWSQWQ